MLQMKFWLRDENDNQQNFDRHSTWKDTKSIKIAYSLSFQRFCSSKNVFSDIILKIFT